MQKRKYWGLLTYGWTAEGMLTPSPRTLATTLSRLVRSTTTSHQNGAEGLLLRFHQLGRFLPMASEVLEPPVGRGAKLLMAETGTLTPAVAPMVAVAASDSVDSVDS